MKIEQLPPELRAAGKELLGAWQARSAGEQANFSRTLASKAEAVDVDEGLLRAATKAEGIAAVSGRVDPVELAAFIDDDRARSRVLDRLAPSFDRVWEAPSWSWTLKSERRAAVLRALGNKITQILSSATTVATDPAGQALRHLLRGERLEETDHGLDAKAVAYAWAAAANPLLKQRAEEIRTRVVQRGALRVYDDLLSDGFFGREAEVDRLRDFVTQPADPGEILVLPVSGIGGSGKSTLLAYALRPMLETAFTNRAAPMLVSMDFDRRCFLGGAELELSMELSRQLALYFPDIGPRLAELRDVVVRQRANRAEFTKSQYDSSTESVSRHGYEFSYEAASVVTAAGVSRRPLVVVLDTFEEWQRAYSVPGGQNSPLWRVMDWLAEISSTWKLTLRVVISGRASLPKNAQFRFADPSIELRELKRGESIALLKKLGVSENAGRVVARLAGGMPLALKLAARYYMRLPPVRRTSFLRDTQAEVHGLGAELRQGVLYRRFLDHITNEDARKLAHPGLALRRVSKELIREVLAGPCGLDVPTDAAARKLVEVLAKEVWLVEEQGPNLVHRPELRKAMLSSMQSDPVQAHRLEEVHRAAAAWYGRRLNDSTQDCAEAVYHRLMVATPDAFDAAVEGVELQILQMLASSANDMPDQIRVQLRDRLGLRITTVDAALLPVERRVTWAERQADELVRSGEPRRALAVWKKYGEDRPPGAWYPAALFQSLEWEFAPRLLQMEFPQGPLRYLYLISFVLDADSVSSAMELRRRLQMEIEQRLGDLEKRPTMVALEDAYFDLVLRGGPMSLPLPRQDVVNRWLGESSMDATRYFRLRKAFPDLAFRLRPSATKGLLASAFRPTEQYIDEMIRKLHLQGRAAATENFALELRSALLGDLTSAQILGGWSDRFAKSVQEDLNDAGSREATSLLAGESLEDPEWRMVVSQALSRTPSEMLHDVGEVLERELGGWTPIDLRSDRFGKELRRGARGPWKRAVEYADRCGVLPALMKVAAGLGDPKLTQVAHAYLAWHQQAEGFTGIYVSAGTSNPAM